MILMCGVSGSGKTQISLNYVKLFPDVIRLSTDECRAIAGVDEGDQTVSHKVFESIYLITEHLLKQGKTIIIDATNYNVKNRKRFVGIAKKLNIGMVALVIGQELTLPQLLERNSQRDRKVPKEIIEKQINGFQAPSFSEGFEEIDYYKGDGTLINGTWLVKDSYVNNS